jgi:choline transport protein
MPVAIEFMNWNSVILVGTVFITALWWFVHAREHYPGPKVMSLYIPGDSTPSSDGVVSNKSD